MVVEFLLHECQRHGEVFDRIFQKPEKLLDIIDLEVVNSRYYAMLYSHSAELAIRAALYLALQPPGRLSTVHTIAAGTGLPKSYLAKIVRKLADTGMVRSFRGPGGGIELGHAPEEISLWSLVSAVDGGGDMWGCVLGAKTCTPGKSCPLHEQWRPIRERMKKLLEKTTLATMVKTLQGSENTHGKSVVRGASSVSRKYTGEGDRNHAT